MRKQHTKEKTQKRLSYRTCALCGASGIPKRAVTKHLEQCKERVSDTSSREKAFYLIAWFPYDPRYWLHIQAPESAKLRDVDSFLRDVWLECCGHLSAFTVGYRKAGMNAKLRDYYYRESVSITSTILGAPRNYALTLYRMGQ